MVWWIGSTINVRNKLNALYQNFLMKIIPQDAKSVLFVKLSKGDTMGIEYSTGRQV